jgi:hypothetical protein
MRGAVSSLLTSATNVQHFIQEKNMKIKLTAFVVSALCTASVFAQSNTPPDSRPPKGQNAALEAALTECAASAAKDTNGRPDHAAMDACMSAKGFKKPPHRDRGAPPPPRKEN